jgi:hypothetical protein
MRDLHSLLVHETIVALGLFEMRLVYREVQDVLQKVCRVPGEERRSLWHIEDFRSVEWDA